LLRAVVDVALELATLLVLRRHEALARGAQLLELGAELLGERDVAKDESGVPRDVLDQPLLRR
jgi:hypothetical protein